MSEANGSWNTIWMRRRSCRMASRSSVRRSMSPRRMLPPSGSISRTRQRAKVDLPEPIPPRCRPVAPLGTTSDTSFTACVTRAPRPGSRRSGRSWRRGRCRESVSLIQAALAEPLAVERRRSTAGMWVLRRRENCARGSLLDHQPFCITATTIRDFGDHAEVVR